MLKHPFTLFKGPLNNKGMSLVEIMVAAGLASIISLGIATMMQNMFEQRKRAMLMSTLREIKIRIESNIRDQGSWTNTMTNNAGLACLRTNTTCTAIYTGAGTPTKIVLYDTAGNIAYDLLSWGDVGTNGFTEIGGPCTGFSATAGAGSDNCPISYRLVYNIWCPSAAASCTNPQLKISGRLIFNPAPGGILNRFRGIINTGSLTETTDAANIDGRYDPVVKRTAVDTNITFRLAAQLPSTGTANDGAIDKCASAVGAGGATTTCSVGGLAIHPLGWTELSDTENLVTVSGTSITFNANQGGPVHCTITVPAFATNGFTAQLYNNTDSIPIATATTVAGKWAMSTAIIEAKFVAIPGKSYVIRQQCQEVPSDPAGAAGLAYCGLGFHTQPYNSGTQDIMSMNCVRLDKTL